MNWLLNLFWCVIGILGGAIISLVLYFKGKTKKQLARKINTICLISNKANAINGLEIKHDSYPIENLYSSTIQIKNVGNSVINSIDIPQTRPLIIRTTGRFILDTQNMQIPDANNENNIRIEFLTDENNLSSTAIIKFDYIDKKQLITLSLLHTGEISFDKWIIIDGETIESEVLLDSMETQRHSYLPKIINYVSIVISILGFFIAITLFLAQNAADRNDLYTQLQQLQIYNYNLDSYIDRVEVQISNMNSIIKKLQLQIETLYNMQQ